MTGDLRSHLLGLLERTPEAPPIDEDPAVVLAAAVDVLAGVAPLLVDLRRDVVGDLPPSLLGLMSELRDRTARWLEATSRARARTAAALAAAPRSP
jgi:hypothetical protein